MENQNQSNTEKSREVTRSSRKRTPIEERKEPSWGGKDVKEGEEIEGVYLGFKEVIIDGDVREKHYLYVYDGEEGKKRILIWGSLVISNLFANATPGHYVFLKYIGKIGRKKHFTMEDGGQTEEDKSIFKAMGLPVKGEEPF